MKIFYRGFFYIRFVKTFLARKKKKEKSFHSAPFHVLSLYYIHHVDFRQVESEQAAKFAIALADGLVRV